MISATLYQPSQPPYSVSIEGLALPDPTTGLARVPEQVSTVLNCSLELVDVLASSPHYVVYSVFDCQGEINIGAMTVLAGLTGQSFDPSDDDEVLLGPVLLVQQQE